MSRRKTVLLLTTTGLIAYGSFLLANLPAAFVWQRLPAGNNMGSKVFLTGLSGTIWSGTAREVTINHHPEDIQLSSLSWNWRPSALISGAAAADIQIGSLSSALEGKGTIAYGFDGITLSNVQADTSAGWVARLLPQKLPGSVSGSVSLSADNLTISQGRCINLDGSLKLANSRVTSPFGAIDLGNTQASLDCQNNKLLATITQSSPAVETQATLTLTRNGQYSLSGSLSKGEALDEKLEQGLKLLGTPDSEGHYPLKLQGHI